MNRNEIIDQNYKRLHRKAIKKGWKTPVNDVFSKVAWIRYWQDCAAYAADPSCGRPIVPHRSA